MPSKSLMKKFAAVVMPKHTQSDEYPHEFYEAKPKYDGDFVDLRDWQTVIDLARKWCDEHYRMIDAQYMDKQWSVQVLDAIPASKHKSLPHAIMQAVCEASKGMGK